MQIQLSLPGSSRSVFVRPRELRAEGNPMRVRVVVSKRVWRRIRNHMDIEMGVELDWGNRKAVIEALKTNNLTKRRLRNES